MIAKIPDDPIPYLVFVQLDKGENLTARVRESVPHLVAALHEIGFVKQVGLSYDGSAFVYFVAANRSFENTLQVRMHLESPRSKKPSGLSARDKVFVATIDSGSVRGLDQIADVLRKCRIPERRTVDM